MILFNPNDNFDRLLKSLDIVRPTVLTNEFLNEVAKHCIDLVSHTNNLPPTPIFEKHPYLPDDEAIDQPVVMIGTFPPISYLKDIIPTLPIKGPMIPTFHGNKGFLLSYLFGDSIFDFEYREAAKIRIHEEFIRKRIHYSDIIKFCQRQDGKYSSRDTSLCNIVLNTAVIEQIFSKPKVTTVYFTNSAFFSKAGIRFTFDRKVNIQNRDAFSLFLSGLQEMNFKVMLNIPETPNWYDLSTDHMQINEHFKGRITVNAKISKEGKEKALRFVSCLSPAAAKRGSVRANPCVQLFARQQNIPLKLAPKELLRSTLQHLTFSGSGRLAQLGDDKFSN